MPDYDKEKLYSQELGKYLSMRNHHFLDDISINIALMMTSMPKMYCNKTGGLLQYLQSDQDDKWNDQGHLYIGQKRKKR